MHNFTTNFKFNLCGFNLFKLEGHKQFKLTKNLMTSLLETLSWETVTNSKLLK
jgi:hypothetical protein